MPVFTVQFFSREGQPLPVWFSRTNEVAASFRLRGLWDDYGAAQAAARRAMTQTSEGTARVVES